MSLILEALRKLEREKQTPERGFLVLGTGAWAERGAAGRPIALFLLGLLLGALALGVMMRSAPTPVASAPAAIAAATAAPPAPHAVSTTIAATQPSVLPASGSPVPTSPAALSTPAATPSAAKFTLQAISEKDGHSVALINDRLLRAGDAIDGARVVAIALDSVELEIGGRRVVLRF